MKTIQYKVYDKEGKLRKLIDKNKEKQLDRAIEYIKKNK